MSVFSSGLCGLAVLASSLVGFSASARSETAGQPAVVHVTERDFHIAAPKQVTGGNLLLKVTNTGPDSHELIIVRATGDRLPLRSDGLTVNEAKLSSVTEPSLEPGPPSSVRTLRLHLRPGHYVFFCNMAGHFMAGMQSSLVVR